MFCSRFLAVEGTPESKDFRSIAVTVGDWSIFPRVASNQHHTMSTLVVPASSPFAQHLAACKQTATVETFEVKSALPNEPNRFNLSLPRNFASFVAVCSDDLKALISSRNGDAFALLFFSIWRLFLALISIVALSFLFGHRLFTAHTLYLLPLLSLAMLHWFICSVLNC
jgi:hypothetical protein